MYRCGHLPMIKPSWLLDERCSAQTRSFAIDYAKLVTGTSMQCASAMQYYGSIIKAFLSLKYL